MKKLSKIFLVLVLTFMISCNGGKVLPPPPPPPPPPPDTTQACCLSSIEQGKPYVDCSKYDGKGEDACEAAAKCCFYDADACECAGVCLDCD